jgi:polysaccharide biosynthesis transport protein
MKIQRYSQPIWPRPNGNGGQPMMPIYADYPVENETERFDLRQVLKTLRRRWLVVATVAIATTTAIGYRTLNRPLQYEAKFRLLVEPVTAETKVTQGSQNNNFGEIVASNLDYETQIEVLRSPRVVEPLLQQLQPKYPELTKDELMKDFTVTRLGQTKILEIRYQNSDPEKVKAVLNTFSQGYLNYSQIQRQNDVIQGIQFVEKQLPELQTKVNTLQNTMQRFRQQYNFIDPENKAEQLSTQLGTISQQRLEVETKLNETRLLYITLQNQLGLQPNQAIVAAALSESPRYQRLLDRLQELERQIAKESVRFTELNPAIQDLREERDRLLPLLRAEAQQIIGNNLNNAKVEPQKLTYQNSIRLALTQQYVDAANQMRAIEVRNQALAKAESELIQQFKQMPVRAREYTDLQRELKIATENLTRFLSTRESLQIEAAQKAVPWQQIAPAEAATPISPNTARNLILGVVAGLLLGVGTAWIVEMLDSVFHSPEDLKDKTGIPLLGIIPFNKSIKKLTTNSARASLPQAQSDAPPSFIARMERYSGSSPFLEAFRSLYTNIRLLGSDMQIRSLVISSATPAEGKTVTAWHLAQAAAAMGQRVLLVDADLRRPQVHVRMGLPNMRGLSNLIASEDLDFNDVVQKAHREDNLYVMTAGQIPPDPTRLLSSGKMQTLMETLQAAFDLVIYDSPPLVGFADANLLAPTTEGLVLVVGLGKTDRYQLMQAIDSLKISGTPILGTIANGIKSYTTRANDAYDRYYSHEKRDRNLAAETIGKLPNS